MIKYIRSRVIGTGRKGDTYRPEITDKIQGAWSAVYYPNKPPYKYCLVRIEIPEKSKISETYQNNTGKILFVTVTAKLEVSYASELDGQSYMKGYIGELSASSQVSECKVDIYNANMISSTSNINTTQSMSFLVPGGYYYKVTGYSTTDGKDPDISCWTEWEL